MQLFKYDCNIRKGRKVDRTRGTEECKWMSFWWSYRKNTRCLCSHSLTQVLLTVITSLFGIAHLRSSSLSLSVRSLIQSLTRGAPTIHHHITLSSQKSGQISSMKRGKKRQHPPSNTVYAEWSCALWWQSIYTWEEGNWYWDRSNIAANEGLLPGKLEKRWWTVEEIYEGLTIKNVEGKKTAENNSNCFPHGASLNVLDAQICGLTEIMPDTK